MCNGNGLYGWCVRAVSKCLCCWRIAGSLHEDCVCSGPDQHLSSSLLFIYEGWEEGRDDVSDANGDSTRLQNERGQGEISRAGLSRGASVKKMEQGVGMRADVVSLEGLGCEAVLTERRESESEKDCDEKGLRGEEVQRKGHDREALDSQTQQKGKKMQRDGEALCGEGAVREEGIEAVHKQTQEVQSDAHCEQEGCDADLESERKRRDRVDDEAKIDVKMIDFAHVFPIGTGYGHR